MDRILRRPELRPARLMQPPKRRPWPLSVLLLTLAASAPAQQPQPGDDPAAIGMIRDPAEVNAT